MPEADTTALQEELEQFRKEKEQIRAIIGQIGGVDSAKRDRFINSAFITAIALLFFFDVGPDQIHVK